MTFRLASERADLFAAIAPVAGHCWVEPRPARPLPTLYLIGSEDPLVPVEGGLIRLPWGKREVMRPPIAWTLERWSTALGCKSIPEVELDDGIRRERYPGPTEFRAIWIEKLGHHWPGGRGQLDPSIGGRPWNRLHAGSTIWDFFQRHARP
jgi:polyhydroxybutyrate depolymerase